MKKIFLLLITVLLFASSSWAQLTGTKNIPGDYATISAAVTSLNSSGVGTGGVVFNVAAGHTETAASGGILITATGTVTNTIVFQKSGTGANPLVTAPVITTATAYDGVIKIAGGDYITIDGIDIVENAANTTNLTDWAYALVKGSATTPFNGCQYVTIKNCNISLNKANLTSIGIYSGNHIATATTALTITATTDAMNNCKFFNNTISNVYGGFSLTGFVAASPYTLYDSNNEIGVGGANTITNLGASTAGVRGIFASNQKDLKVANNTINSSLNGLSASSYGIFTSLGVTSNIDIYNNTITLTVTTGSFTPTLYAIYNAMGNTGTTNTVNIYNNTISSCNLSAATTGSLQGITNTGTAAAINIYGNTVSGNTVAGTGNFVGIYNNANVTTNPLNMYSNTIINNTKTGASGNMYCTQAVTANINFYLNSIHDNSAGGTSILYGYYNIGAPITESYYNNNIYNLTVSGAGTLNAFQLSSTATGPKNIYGNSIYSLSNVGNVNGISSIVGSPANIYKNNIYNISTSGAATQAIGINYTGTTGNIYNNYISDIKATASTNTTAVIGINLGGTTQNLYYNTIYLNASSTSASTFGSAGIYKSATTLGDFRNNIIVNNSTAGPTGASYTVAFRNSAVYNATYYAATSNYNCFYAGIPSTSNLIFYDGINANQTIGDFQTLSVSRDAASFREIPPFINTTTAPFNLHLQNTITTGCESGGLRITVPAITDDFDANIRWGETGYTGNGTATDIGADEFEGIPNYTCGLPAPGNSIASVNSLCLGNSTVLSLQNISTQTGIDYQWKSSTDGTNYSNISGATASTYTATPLLPTYYKCNVTCQNGPLTTASNPIQITFSANIASTTSGSRCNSGTVSLTATAGGTGILAWHATPTGGAILGTGSPFVTPNISTTTNYYVGEETYAPANIATGAGALTSSTYSNPFYSANSNNHTQHLISASSLQAAGLSAGNITSVALDVTSAGTLPMIDLSVKIGTTTAVSMSSFIANTSFSTVYTNASFLPVVGLNTLTFTTPFNWDGISNIVLEFCHGNAVSGATMSRTIKTDATSYISTIKANVSAATSGATICSDITSNLLSYSESPKFVFAGQGVCSSPRIAVTATVNPAPVLAVTPNQTICNDAISNISVTSTLTDYDSYLWTPATGLYTDALATIPYVSGTSATSLYVKTTNAGVTSYICSASNAALCANTATSTVTVLPSSPAITAVSSPLCGSGKTVLSVSPSTGYGNASFQWKSSTDSITFNNIAGHTNLYDTTAIINSTTHYLLIIKDGTGNSCTQSAATVIVNNPQVLTTTPAGRCGAGSLSLGATSSTGTVLKWYASSTGGSALGTGTSFTTPVIPATSTFYVAADLIGTSTTSTIGNGSVSSSDIYTPFNGSYGGIKTQYLFTAAELNAANIKTGSINSISIEVTALGITYSGFYIQMGNTNLTNFTSSANIQGGLTTVYNAATITPAVGTNTYNFSTPFIWDGISNIIISMSWSNANAGNTSATIKTDPTTNYSSQSYRKDSDTPANILAFTGSTGILASSQNRPQIKFNFTPICSSNRSSVTATITAPPALTLSSGQTICNNSIAPISVTSTIADYTSFTWSPVNYLYTDTACTIPYTALTNATKVYTKPTVNGTVIYTCSANNSTSLCDNSANVNFTINPIPSAITITPTASSICLGATELLSTSGGTMTNIVLYSENFNSASNNWITTNSSTGGTSANAAWTLKADGYVYSSYGTWHSNDNSQFYLSNSDAIGSGANTMTKLESPSINTNGFTSLSLKFWHYYRYNTDSAMVEISTDNATTWNTLKIYKATQGTINAFVRDSIDITSYINMANVKIRFNYDDASGYFWGIDNVSVTGNQNTTMIWSPLTELYTDAAGTIAYTGLSATSVYSKPSVARTYTATATNSVLCTNTGTSVLSITALPANAGLITGTSTICQGVTGVAYTVPAIIGATNYIWTYTGTGVNITGTTNNITISFSSTATSGILTVKGQNTCGFGIISTDYPITVNPLPAAAGVITGTATVCQGQATVLYTVPVINNATSYIWTYSGSGATYTPAATTTTDSVKITFSATATSGNLKVKGANASCGNGLTSANYFITTSPLPSAAGAITGTASICPGQSNVTYTVPAIGNASTYGWSYSGTGATITGTGNSVTISFTTNATSGNLTVHGVNSCGNGVNSANYPITIVSLPLAAGTITGSATVCQSQNNVIFTVPVITNATSYTWVYSGTGHTIVGNTNSITMNFSATATPGNLTVTGHNSCGDGTVSASFPITTNPLPGAVGVITGTATVCQGQNNVTYSVPAISNASTYIWTYSGTGHTITGTTNSITINFSATATNGNLTVQGSNSCGNSAVSAIYPITINTLPSAAGVIVGVDTVCTGDVNIPFTTTAIVNATTYTWNYSGTGATIINNGTSITVSFASSALSGILTVKGTNTCGSGTISTNHPIFVKQCVGINDPLNTTLNYQIYPNPTSGIITININDINTSLDLQIINLQGKIIHTEKLSNIKSTYNQDINLSEYPKGVYFVKLINKNFTKVEKIVLQ
ncbi:MAG: T9SS type A sorting domain-containing protein [Bacteroidales bacterium]